MVPPGKPNTVCTLLSAPFAKHTAATSRTVSIPVAQSSTLTRQGLPIALLCTQARENRACHSMGCQPRTRRTARPRWVYLLRHCNRVVGKHRNGSDGPTTVVGCDCTRLNLAAAAAAAAGSVCRSQSPNQSHSSVIPSMSFFCFRAFPVHFAVQFAPALRLHTVELRECTRPRPATSLGQYPVPAPLFNPSARPTRVMVVILPTSRESQLHVASQSNSVCLIMFPSHPSLHRRVH